MTAFTDLLADPEATRVYLIEASPLDATGSPTETVTYYWSSHPFTTEPSDTPANQYYEPRVTNAIRFRREVSDQNRVRGPASSQVGEIVLASGDNADGNYLDAILQLIWDGAPITIKLGGLDFAYTDFGTIFTGTAEGVDATLDAITIRIRDNRYLLEIPIQDNLYLGTGGVAGGDDLLGSPVPLSYGKPRNCEPVYLGVIGGNDTFQIHDGAMDGADAVRSSGEEINETSGSPLDPGDFDLNRSTGVMTLGGSTRGTVITMDVRGDAPGSPFPVSAADIIENIVTTKTSVTMASGTVGLLNGKNAAPCGIYITDGSTRIISDVIREFALSVGAIDFLNREGNLQLVRIENPAGTADASFGSTEIISIERLAAERPLSKATVGYAKNFRVQQQENLVSATTEADRKFAIKEYRYVSGTVSGNDNPQATEEVFDTLLIEKSDAQTEADRLYGLYSVEREVFRVVVKTQPFTLELGDTVEITDDRFNLSAGKNFLIIGLDEDASINEIELTLWG